MITELAIVYFFPKNCVYKYILLIVFIGDKMSETASNEIKVNPLSQWFRQPKIYIKLPSNGEFYPDGALDRSVSGDYPVYAMTAKDELMFKTPDALLSGQSTVEVIKSCVPAIKEPWAMPSIDVDVVLVAIRVATYGNDMEVESNCPECNAENAYDVDLAQWIGSISNFEYEAAVNCDPLIVHIRPYNYQELTKTGLKTMEQQRIFSVVNDDSISDENKLKMFGESFVKLTELTVDIIAGCITKIDSPNGSTSDPQFIKDFIDNSPKSVFDAVSDHIVGMKARIEFKPVDVKCSECSTKFAMPISMDHSNFFAVRS
jgi:hypothetical protein